MILKFGCQFVVNNYVITKVYTHTHTYKYFIPIDTYASLNFDFVVEIILTILLLRYFIEA